jgi:hypothetical protein
VVAFVEPQVDHPCKEPRRGVLAARPAGYNVGTQAPEIVVEYRDRVPGHVHAQPGQCARLHTPRLELFTSDVEEFFNFMQG